MIKNTAEGYHPPTLLESLEPRVAPAVIINVGAPTDNDPGNTTYNEAPFVKASLSTDPGIASLFAGSTDHYVLTLAAGDKVRMFDPAQGYKDFINVTGGKLLAFFYDKHPADGGIVEAQDLVGFSVGAGAGLSVAGSVDGDIIANFDSKTGLISKTSLLADTTSISSLNVAGGIGGSVIAGGNIGKISIQGNVEQISTSSDGTYVYDFGGKGAGAGIGEATLAAFIPATGKAGSNISGVTVGSLDKIVSGSGGAGGNGGAISSIKVTSDFDGFQIIGGNGGVGSKGGNGGAISDVVVYGTPDADPLNPVYGTIKILGGSGATVVAGAGGSGGAVSKVYVGFQPSGAKLVQSPTALNDYVEVSGGTGGAGSAAGGAGGLLSGINVYTAAPDDPTPGKYEIKISGGDGGLATLPTGKGGTGGSVSGILSFNLNDSDAADLTKRDQTLVSGGNAGLGSGSAGGSITDASILGDNIFLLAGNGSNGTTAGGAGGAISKVTFNFSPTDNVDAISILGGNGGTAANGSAGAGGSVSTVTGTFLNFVDLTNQVRAGNGGVSTGGIGGKGGDLTSISLFEPVYDTAHDASISFAAGAGGNGGKTGGLGGSVASLTFLGFDTLPTVSAGDGGDITLVGTGGAGGGISNLSLKISDVNPAIGAGVVTVTSGAGGDGLGATGKGGNGGSFTGLSTVIALVTPANSFPIGLDVAVSAGNGGAGGTGTVGAGGAISKITATASQGDVTVLAGAAGPAGTATKGAAGGALSNASVYALGAVTLKGGDGRLGGAGGNIATAAWYGVDANFNPSTISSPTGNVLVQAGQGSVGPAAAGIGGSLSSLTGRGSSLGTTKIYAGDGNGGVLGSKAANGGSINGLTLSGGASLADVFAGNGGSLANSATGAGGIGGSISNINAPTGVNFHTIAAGNGGNSGAGVPAGKGGLGGTISNLNVFNDIGTRSGSAFGIDGMGGLFAGAGGTGGTPAMAGKAGNVTNVTAAAISSIVAGRPTVANPETLQLVTLVDRISLNALVAPTVDGGGAFTNFGTANFVGGISGNPTDAGANVFKVDVGGVSTPIGATNPYPWTLGTTKPLDGLVAAITYSYTNKNYRPEAFLTTVGAGVSNTGYALTDYRNNFNTNS